MNRHGRNCYTYVIGWRHLDTWYYGARWANKLDPVADLWWVYKTSSKHLKKFVEVNGEPDVIRVMREFDSEKAARVHETRFMIRFKCVRDKRWLNKGMANGRFTHSRPHSNETKALIGQRTRERFQDPEYRLKHSVKNSRVIGDQYRANISAGMKRSWTPERRIRHAEHMKMRWSNPQYKERLQEAHRN